MRIVLDATMVTHGALMPIKLTNQLHGVLAVMGREPIVNFDRMVDLAIVWELALADATRLEHERRRCDELQRALDSRVIVEQAKGVISAQRGIDPDEGFLLLRKYSRDNRVPLPDAARDVVHRDLRL